MDSEVEASGINKIMDDQKEHMNRLKDEIESKKDKKDKKDT